MSGGIISGFFDCSLVPFPFYSVALSSLNMKLCVQSNCNLLCCVQLISPGRRKESGGDGRWGWGRTGKSGGRENLSECNT